LIVDTELGLGQDIPGSLSSTLALSNSVVADPDSVTPKP